MSRPAWRAWNFAQAGEQAVGWVKRGDTDRIGGDASLSDWVPVIDQLVDHVLFGRLLVSARKFAFGLTEIG
jgi:hypothetical protein